MQLKPYYDAIIIVWAHISK